MSIKTIAIFICVLLGATGLTLADRDFSATAQNPAPTNRDRVSSIFEAFDRRASDKTVKERLDALGDYLRAAPSHRSYIVSYAGLRSCRGEALARAQAVKDYLARLQGITPDRITTIDGGYHDEWTVQLWTAAGGASQPTPIPTVDRRRVKIFRKCRSKAVGNLGLVCKSGDMNQGYWGLLQSRYPLVTAQGRDLVLFR